MQITAQQQNQIAQIAKKFDLKLVLLYGSQVSGKTHQSSDIDLAVIGFQNLSLDVALKLHQAFGEVLAGDIDICVLQQVDALIRYQIAQTSQLLYGAPRDYTTFRVHAFHQYMYTRKLREAEKLQVYKLQEYLAHKYA